MLINYINAQFFNIIWDSIQLSVTLIFGKRRVEFRTKELYDNMHHMQKTAMELK